MCRSGGSIQTWEECRSTSERKSRTLTYEDLSVLLLELALEKESDNHLNAYRPGGNLSGRGCSHQGQEPSSQKGASAQKKGLELSTTHLCRTLAGRVGGWQGSVPDPALPPPSLSCRTATTRPNVGVGDGGSPPLVGADPTFGSGVQRGKRNGRAATRRVIGQRRAVVRRRPSLGTVGWREEQGLRPPPLPCLPMATGAGALAPAPCSTSGFVACVEHIDCKQTPSPQAVDCAGPACMGTRVPH